MLSQREFALLKLPEVMSNVTSLTRVGCTRCDAEKWLEIVMGGTEKTEDVDVEDATGDVTGTMVTLTSPWSEVGVHCEEKVSVTVLVEVTITTTGLFWDWRGKAERKAWLQFVIAFSHALDSEPPRGGRTRDSSVALTFCKSLSLSAWRKTDGEDTKMLGRKSVDGDSLLSISLE